MTEPTDAQLIEWLRLRATDDADLGFDDDAEKLELAAQRLKARGEISEEAFVRALEAYGQVWDKRRGHQAALRAALEAAKDKS